jgi:hypothetical protein
LSRVARRLEEEGTITDATPAHCCYIVAKFVFQEQLRLVRPEVNSDDSDFDSAVIAASSNPPPDQTEQKMLDCLDLCLQKLVPRERDLILEYYGGEQGEKIQRWRELAEQLELSTNALSIRACRIRDRRLLLLPLRAEPLTQIRGKWKNISGPCWVWISAKKSSAPARF